MWGAQGAKGARTALCRALRLPAPRYSRATQPWRTRMSSCAVSPSPRSAVSVSDRKRILSSAWSRGSSEVPNQRVSTRRCWQRRRGACAKHAAAACGVPHVGSVGDELAQEDVFVAVQRVDEDVHQARHFRLKLIFLARLAQLVHIAVGRRGGIAVSNAPIRVQLLIGGAFGAKPAAARARVRRGAGAARVQAALLKASLCCQLRRARTERHPRCSRLRCQGRRQARRARRRRSLQGRRRGGAAR